MSNRRAQGKRARDAPNGRSWPMQLRYPQMISRTGLEMASSDVITGAINRISKAFALMPVRLYRGFEPVTDDIRAELLSLRANRRQSAYQFKLAMELSRNTVGRAYAVKRFDDAFSLAAIETVAPERVTPKIDTDTQEIWYVIRRDDGEEEYLHNWFVLPLLFASTDGITSISPTQLLRGTVEYNENVKTFSLDNLKSINKAIVLEYPATMSGPAREKSVQETYDLYLKSGGKVLALDSGVRLSNVTGSPFDAGAEKVEAVTRSRVEMVYDMPGGMLGGSDKAVSAEEINLRFLTMTMQPRVEEWTQALDWWLLTPQERRSGWHYEIEIDAYLKANAQARANLLQTQMRNGQKTPNEARAVINLPPMPGGDILYASKDLAPLELIAKGATIDLNTLNGEKNSRKE